MHDGNNAWEGGPAVAVALVVVLVLLALGGGATFLFFRQAEAQRAMALEHRAMAEAERARVAEQDLAGAASSGDVAVALLQALLAHADPEASDGGQVSVRAILEAAEVQALRSDLRPEVRTALERALDDARARLAGR